MRKYPFEKQETIQGCGPACTLMIIRYYHGYIPLEKLSEMLRTSKKGTTAYHIVSVLNTVGFNAKGIKTNKLDAQAVPFIASVTIENSYKHYIVVYEVKDNYILIADPAKGIRKISHQEFHKMWTGINIVMKPVRPITKEKQVSIRKILKYLPPYKIDLIKIGMLSLIITVSSVIASFFFQGLIEYSSMKAIVIAFSFLMFLEVSSTYVRSKILIKVSTDLDNKLTKDIFNQILSLPYHYYHNHTTGDVISRLNDLSLVKSLFSKVLITIFVDLPLSLFSGLLLFYLNKLLFGLTLIILLVYVLILLIYRKRLKVLIDIDKQNKAEVNSYMTEAISAFETIKGIDISDKIKDKVNQKYDVFTNNNIKLNTLLNNQSLFKNINSVFGQASIILVGVFLAKKGSLALTSLITFITITSLFLEPIRNIIDLDFEYKESINALKRVLCLIKDKEEKTIPRGDIVINNLSYTFDDITPILKNINLYIKQGSKILITGKSGSGKSTLLKIIKGYFKDYKGNITIGKEKPSNSPNILYLKADDTLFTGTLQYNLSLRGNNNKDICYTKEIIASSPFGLNTPVEEATNFSQGQRQRLCLSRSLYDFDILLLDEALNQTDVNTERKILKNLFRAYKNKTIIYISHRLDNLDLFERYIILENGEITLDEKRNI